MRRLKRLIAGLVVAAVPIAASAQVVFFELDQLQNIFNRVQEGAGLSGDGSSTPGQFTALHTFGGVAPLTGSNPVEGPSNGTGSLKIQHMRVGAPLYGRFTNYLFGAVLPLPDTDEDGIELSGVNPSDYWNARPFRESDRLGYAWDEGRNRVLASEGGTFDIVWQRSRAEIGKPADYETSPENYHVEAGVYYRLYEHSHVGVSRGDSIPPPLVEADGATALAETDTTYWNPIPYVLRATERYHYSASANAVFATQPGPVSVTWQRIEPTAGDHSGDDNYVENGGRYYRLLNKRYVISGSPVKEPKKIYWSEAGNVGVPVLIPASTVSKLQIVYNSDVPRNVPVSEGVVLGEGSGVSSEGSNVATAITSTLWYSATEKALKSLNRQGRLFVEFLGTPDSVSGVPEHLGFEVVDIVKDVVPLNESVHLGEAVPDVYDESDGEKLVPRVANTPDGENYLYQHFESSDLATAGDLSNAVLFARRETENVNDVVLWWLEKGVQGVLWPKEYVRYDFKWPSDIASFSHYMRPLVGSELEAKETSVLLNGDEAPRIEYQDQLDQVRAKLTADNRFYTILDENFPAHRTLLRFISGNEVRFERVFSWLDTTLSPLDSDDSFVAGSLGTSVAQQLDSYDPTSGKFTWPDESSIPYVFDMTVPVGERLPVPNTAFGSGEGEEYWAGYLNLDIGDSFNPNAYIDPFEFGFDEANRGAIIPVNSIPGDNKLEALWFRRSDDDETDGFSAHYWPSALGRYTVEWPSSPSEIVLASNDGTGPLSSLLAKGSVYYQNDSSAPGYNPNEEHALMQGGQAFALRDDLNVVTNDSGEYSSDPYVILEYEDTDGRLSMKPYKVLREKLSEGEVFTYPVEAGTILQAPMPLPLMDLPLLESGESEGFNVSKEADWVQIQSSDVQDPMASQVWEFVSAERPALAEGSAYNLQSSDLSETKKLYVESYSYDANTIRGIVGGAEVSISSLSVTDTETSGWGYHFLSDQNPHVYYSVNSGSSHLSSLAIGDPYHLYLPVRGELLEMTLVSQETSNGVDILVFEAPEALRSEDVYNSGLGSVRRYQFGDVLFDDAELIVTDGSLADGALDNWYVSQSPLASDDLVLNDYRSKFTYQDRKGNMWVYRGPHSKQGPAPDEAFSVQFYYKTLPGFYFPASGANQPDVGTIVPYLRSSESDGSWSGPAFGSAEQALAISYRPYWPDTTPVLFTGETLTNPKRGLPAVRGQISAEVLYQQSAREENAEEASVVLHDPTREKSVALSVDGLEKIPGSAVTEGYLGKTYFSLLPPHLGSRFFYDPIRGEKGHLVYKGQFVDEVLGEDYLQLNILSESDKEKLKGLVVDSDEDKDAWDLAIDSLATTLETFEEDEDKPGTYKPNVALNKVVGEEELASINNEDIAVDSYALSAVGPGSGYVTMIFGNGEAFTPVGDPVVMQILRVDDALYRGEVKPVLSSNPLNEMLTMRQISDFAGAVDDYEFEWKIASPVDGADPVVNLNERVLLMGDDTWSHLRFPTVFDSAVSFSSIDADRLGVQSAGSVTAVESLAVSSTTENGTTGEHEFTSADAGEVEVNDSFVIRDATDDAILVRGTANSTDSVLSVLALEEDASGFVPVSIEELAGKGLPASFLHRTFTSSKDLDFSAIFLSLDIATDLGARVFVNGVEVVVANASEVSEDALNSPTTGSPAGFETLSRVYSVPVEVLLLGTDGADEVTHDVSVELYSSADADTVQDFNLRIEAYHRVDKTEESWIALDPSRYPDGVRTVLGETADVRALADNYLIMRYRPKLLEDGSARADDDESGYSQWTRPALAEGWIKRVLAGINPFNQRVTNLFANNVDTDASILTEAGPRWEGDVALNLSTINDYGLIEIYETVLNRGRMLSIDAGINYGPANDALLLAAGYLSDLYMMLGNEAKADALNPTIGIGTANSTYGDIATSMFAFEGQLSSLLEEELALWRGRSDFLQPGVEIAPVYNRLVWNYTRGIDSGEVIYALNYNIKEDQNGELDGTVNAEDAAVMYPQGHGDAYGHYLTALKGYFKLFMDEDFSWVPRIEAVNVLGVPVAVDYQDERKFAAAAVQVAQAGQQVMELTWRQDYQLVEENGWEHLASTRSNDRRTLPSSRYWGVDHWASRTQQGTYLNWVVGNSMLPDVDDDASHEGIQVVDRRTVTELEELTRIADATQASLDNAEAGLNPLGFDPNSMAFDLDPVGFGTGSTSHFEQVLDRAKLALSNAVIAFDDAKDVTRLMRSEEDSLSDFQAKVDSQELAFKNRLIEIYGTPYPDDIGPGKTYDSGYDGPDLFHYQYVEDATLEFGGAFLKDEDIDYELNIRVPPSGEGAWVAAGLGDRIDNGTATIDFNLTSTGLLKKPEAWNGSRLYAGKLQLAINDILMKRNAVYLEIENYRTFDYLFERQLEIFEAKVQTMADIKGYNEKIRDFNTGIKITQAATELITRGIAEFLDYKKGATEVALSFVPDNMLFGLASGGDITSSISGTIETQSYVHSTVLKVISGVAEIAGRATVAGLEAAASAVHYNEIVPAEILQAETEAVFAVDTALQDLLGQVFPINRSIQQLEASRMKYQALLAQGLAVQAEREVFRKRAASVIQGYRTRNASFRLFRNEKLERYKSLFDLAARYSYLAAQAYDYETGLLGTDEGQDFVKRIVESRALGVVQGGEPQFAGSDQGDPGLSSILAEMSADWEVLRSRLGYNNPDVYGTLFSLRSENFRILPGIEGDDAWKDILEAGRVADLKADPDLRRYAMQLDDGSGLPVPGIVLEFSSHIGEGYNFMGRQLAAGDHSYSPTSFATKIFSSGVVLSGYEGMDNPTSVTNSTQNGSSPSDPDLAFLDEDALAATPYIYLIPVGKDVMRTPPLGDQSELRSWSVEDVTIPLPFNIGASEHSSKAFYQTQDSLTEPLFQVRKHQAFRPVSDESVYQGDNGRLFASEFTNSRLIGRSVWNTKWKIVIPGRTLLNDPDEGLERFIETVKDIKLHLETYSYSGN
ncbi:hypothetical protein [Pelagicoccus mobilis]|uniref:Uncharacterized protein n=1 Tax=Pelagicoccus mobilis TaxID=415221 RepID=A0A934RY61_9BACT|nr:hypothetical protein [Pelagicoccus mobilis]MBK1875703.1 hypothetical protein [Pelagicoccus mobilis]